MARKKYQPPQGVPDWLLTYGDIMSLLLCFFVLICAMSEMKADKRYSEVVKSIQRAFGLPGGFGLTASSLPPNLSPEQVLLAVAGKDDRQTKGRSNERAQAGMDPAVKTIYEGRIYKVGGSIAFPEGEATLPAEAQADLRRVVDQIRGLTLKVEVRGHASKVPLPEGSPYRDHIDLSAARARAVRDWLVDPTQGGLDPRRLRVVACGAEEPVREPAYDRTEWTRNDRVEIMLTEALVSDFETPAAQAENSWDGQTEQP